MDTRSRVTIALRAGIASCATSPVVLRSTGAGAACRYVEFSSLPGLRFTVENGVITRADAGPGVLNTLGVQLGDTTDSVVALNPDVAVLRNRDSSGGTDLILTDPDGRYAIVMQAAGNKTIAIRAGLSAAVGSLQGCP